jgi:probable selenium-dependent hydroxylase accessory protein YqeC
MDLVTAVGSTDGPVCVVGAGGKTTTLYALASRMERAIVTATVRIPVFDREVATVEVSADPVERLDTVERFPLGLVPEREGSDRYRGYDPGTVDAIAESHDGPVLVKADGARMREFKAPDDHEPRIPDSTAVVAPVVSSHIVGKPLTGHWVHRPEAVAALTGSDIGDEITADTVATVLTHEQGGLKGVPAGADVVPLVTKVDSPAHERVARDIAERVHDRADGAAVTLPRVALARFGVVETV